MTAHIFYDYACLKCDERYLPFSEEQRACPKCKNIAKEDEGTPNISDIVCAAMINLTVFNNSEEYLKEKFKVSSLADKYVEGAMAIINLVNPMFKSNKDKKKNLEKICSELMGGLDFSKEPHYEKHASSFIMEVLKEAYLNNED